MMTQKGNNQVMTSGVKLSVGQFQVSRAQGSRASESQSLEMSPTQSLFNNKIEYNKEQPENDSFIKHTHNNEHKQVLLNL